ncbi:MAG: META domain-containing protein [Novosphingobium sp.]
MIGRLLILACAAGAAVGCATLREAVPQLADRLLVLEAVDGVRVKDVATFQLRFAGNGNYVAAYDCGEHSGTYRLGSRLTFQPGASTGQTCDRTDIASGRTIRFDRRHVDRFFADPDFGIRASGARIVLSNRQHTFRFSWER